MLNHSLSLVKSVFITMSPNNNHQEHSESFGNYLRFISDMLGGDLLPLNNETNNIQKIISQQAIDYDLMRSIVSEIKNENAIFQLHEVIEAFSTLDALGKVRGKLLRHRGDIHQISLIDRIGEFTVGFFNLPPSQRAEEKPTPAARVIHLK